MTPEELAQNLAAVNLALYEIQQRLQEVRVVVAKAKAASDVVRTLPASSPSLKEPRLTLGRVPAGGEGYYVVYLSENETELAIALSYYRDSEHRFPSWSPFHIKQEFIMASFGPVPDHSLVASEWHAAGRPT